MKRFLMVVMLGLFSTVHADVTGAGDVAVLNQLIAQYKLLQDQLNTIEQQKKTLEDGNNLLKGHYGYSSLYESSTLKNWQHSGGDFNSALSGTQNDPLAKIMQEMEKSYPSKSALQVFPHAPNSEQARLYESLAKTTMASGATNTLAYNSIEETLKMLEALQAQIEQSPNSKSTLDLIARIQIEVAKMTAMKIKADAMNAQLNTLHAQEEINDAKWVAEFAKWH